MNLKEEIKRLVQDIEDLNVNDLPQQLVDTVKYNSTKQFLENLLNRLTEELEKGKVVFSASCNNNKLDKEELLAIKSYNTSIQEMIEEVQRELTEY